MKILSGITKFLRNIFAPRVTNYYFKEGKVPKEAWNHFEKAFKKMDEAFEMMEKVFKEVK